MFDDLKKERQKASVSQGRWMAYVAVLLVMAGIVAAATVLTRDTPQAAEMADETAPRIVESNRPVIELAKLPTGDGTGVHARYDVDALEYLFSIVDNDYAPEATRLSLAEVAALPFAEARGKVFETLGTVEGIDREVSGTGETRLWSVLLRDDAGNRVAVLKRGLGSDMNEGRPEDAITTSTEYVTEGERLLVRGIYLQRRTGSISGAMLRDPVPILVATPPFTAFRKVPPAAVPIEDPNEADWDDVKDRYLGETQNLTEPALFQIVQWARARGHEQILEDIRSGVLEAEPWDDEAFDRWEEEVDSVDPNGKRPVTESVRGRFFQTTGYIGSFQGTSWGVVPREGGAWDVHMLYILDLVGDHYAHQSLRNLSVWPRSTYEGVIPESEQHVRVYGFFLKNHTYTTRKMSETTGTSALVTMPMFIIVHVEPLPSSEAKWVFLIWVVSGILVVLVALFWLVFVRGERKESREMEARRLEMRRNRRRLAEEKSPGAGSVDLGHADDGPDTGTGA